MKLKSLLRGLSGSAYGIAVGLLSIGAVVFFYGLCCIAAMAWARLIIGMFR